MPIVASLTQPNRYRLIRTTRRANMAAQVWRCVAYILACLCFLLALVGAVVADASTVGAGLVSLLLAAGTASRYHAARRQARDATLLLLVGNGKTCRL